MKKLLLVSRSQYEIIKSHGDILAKSGITYTVVKETDRAVLLETNNPVILVSMLVILRRRIQYRQPHVPHPVHHVVQPAIPV